MANETTKKAYGLIALGRLPAATRDLLGDTMGSFSGLALEPGSWRATKGGFAGVLVALPDRGFNVPERGKFSDYQSRVYRLAFDLSGSTLSLTPLDTRLLRDGNGAVTTGIDPGRGTTKQFGIKLPSPKKGPGAGRVSVDSEGLAVADDGRFFVSDEFAANIYCCAPDGRMTDVIAPPGAFVPRIDGEACFSSADGIEPDCGRAPNDGFEGLSLSPDGKQLYALLQSPLVQDRRGKAETQRFTRLLVYEISNARPALSAQYVVELPLFADMAGGRATQPAEANEIIALAGGRILVLARESFGFGAKDRNAKAPIAFKRVMAGTLSGATNLAGTRY